MKKQINSQKFALGIFCGLLMLITGASDSLRGVFLPQIQEHFALNKTKTSMIIMISYIGTLIFLLVGGYIIDKVSKKKFILVNMLIWMSALLIYSLTSNYFILLIVMIFSMGASTMLSTSINIITPMIFASPAFFINIFCFSQGVGMTSAQNIGGRFANKFSSWQYANLILLGLGIIGVILLLFLKLPKNEIPKKNYQKSGYADVFKNPACKYLLLLCGFYYVAEHGLQNWLVSYSHEHLDFSISKSATYLSIFFGAITIGRLVFAPVVQKIGILKSISIFASFATIFFSIGFFAGKTGIILICISGLGFSILWPTLVLLISKYYPKSQAGIAIGVITSLSAFFDIAFNGLFGKAIEKFGYNISIKLLPLAILSFTICFFLLKYRVDKSKEIN